ncbi:lipopolysaccharide biosynthesis protein [Arsenicitalea aurantiaca]|uniref:Lipopolysaccharide biosynthesis protein n=2 Tax=Arsenicitalea aurantiaca TaxID=1783274 RepID=A0A433XM76_9HYPH|nr:lipopolysaccharide biosynthesis protein [Arsenicitalea aurantiaca]
MASGGSLLAAAAAQLVTFATLASQLGPDQFGLYVVITAITTIAVPIVGLGAQECLVRRVARDRSIYPAMLGHNLILIGGTGLPLLLIGLVVLPIVLPLSADPLVNHGGYLLLLASNLILHKVIFIATQAFIAHSRFAPANGLEVFYAFARTAAALLACLVFGVERVADWAVWYFACHVLVTLVALFALRQLGAPQWRIVRDEIWTGILFATQFIFRTLRQNTDLLVIAMVTSPEVTGSYGIARRILDSSYLSVEALNRLIYPGSAAASVAGLHKISRRARNVLLAAVGIAVLAALAIFICAPILPLLFGAEYVSLVSIVRVLCWGVILFAAYAVALDTLGASGNQRVRAWILNSANMIGAGLIAVLTWQFGLAGAFGAFYATEVALVVASLVVLVFLTKADRARAQEGAT